MSKFLAIIKREYLPRVRTKGFIVSTVLGPLIMIGMAVLPAMIFMINADDATRLAVVDQTGEIYEHVRESVLRERDERGASAAGESLKTTDSDRSPDERMRRAGATARPNFEIEQVPQAGRAIEELKRELSGRVRQGEIDAYVILPPDILASGEAEYYGGNVGDMITLGQVRERLSRAVIERRMAEAKIDQSLFRRMSTPISMRTIKISEQGEEKDTGGGFFLVLGIGGCQVICVNDRSRRSARLPQRRR